MDWKLSLVGVTVVASLAASCGDNNANNGPPPSNSQNNSNNDNNSNNGTGGTNSNNGTANNGTTGTNNDINNPNQDCPDVEEFEDESFTIEREFAAANDVSTLSCAGTVGEIATNGTYVARVQYSAPTTATITVSAVVREGEGRPPRPGLEIRKGACQTGEVLECSTTTSYQVEFEPDVPYFLVFNGLLDSGGLSLKVDATSAICSPSEVTCENGELLSCNAEGTAVNAVGCPEGCVENRCSGDRCDAPLVVSPEVNGPKIIIAGNRSTLSADWDANNGAGCELYEGQGPASTPGGELFIRVPGVTAGQRVTVDMDDSELTYGFFVIQDCAATTCVAGFVFDANARNRADYVATEDGDVLFVVEALGEQQPRDFTIEVSIVE